MGREHGGKCTRLVRNGLFITVSVRRRDEVQHRVQTAVRKLAEMHCEDVFIWAESKALMWLIAQWLRCG